MPATLLFQSTCPLRGTTTAQVKDMIPRLISIHVPLAGHDACPIAAATYLADFNPRAPCGARLHRVRVVDVGKGISIHVPLAGHDARCSSSTSSGSISIHVPLAGHDRSRSPISTRRWHFNPRAPCGARPRPGPGWKPLKRNFNPRAPCGARRYLSRRSCRP